MKLLFTRNLVMSKEDEELKNKETINESKLTISIFNPNHFNDILI